MEGSYVIEQVGAFIMLDASVRLIVSKLEVYSAIPSVAATQSQNLGFWRCYLFYIKNISCLQFKEITARFEKIEPVRSMFDSKQHSSSIQCTTSPNRLSAAPNQHKPVSQQVATDHHWPVSELKVPSLGGITRGNSPKSKPFAEGKMSPFLSYHPNWYFQ